jgi:HEAT repeat protein
MTDATTDELLDQLERLENNPFGAGVDPVDFLNECLYHSDREVRDRALGVISHLPNADFIEPLFRIIDEDDDLDVRRSAIDTLGSFLHHGSMADYDVSLDESGIELDEQLDEDTGMEEMDRIQFSAIRDFLGQLVDQPDWPPSLRGRALVHYARIEPEEASRRIEQFYQSEDSYLVIAAVEAIGRLPGGDWTSLIMTELTRQPDDARKRAAVEAVGVHELEEAGPELVNIIEETDNAEIRQAAVESLSLIPWEEAPEYLQQYQDDPDEVVREIAQNGLKRWAHIKERNEQI